MGAVSMNKINVQIWGRSFDLSYSFQNFPDEEITEVQQQTLQSVSTVDYSHSKEGVEKYIRKYFFAELGSDDLKNIFRFVMPKSVLIPRNSEDHVFAVMCSFKLDMEHGIALIYKNKEFIEAGPQDIIL